MSVALELGMLSDDNIKKVLGTPLLIWRVVSPDNPNILRDVMSLSAEGWSAKREPELPPLELTGIEKTRCGLDKAWHGVHYLLTKTPWEGNPPLNVLVSGGTPVGDVDVGYGPARVLTSTEVLSLNRSLEPIDHNYLRTRFDPEDMMAKEIYPRIWDRAPAEDDTLGYCLQYFDVFKDFVRKAVTNNMGLVVRIC